VGSDALPPKKTIFKLAKILWDYNNVSRPPVRADFLLVMGTNDHGVAKYAAKIDKIHDYPHIIVSGGAFHETSIHKKPFNGTEADVFADVLIAKGVNPSKIIREPHATNTGENVTLTKQLLQTLGIQVKSGQLVHRPATQRRAIATAECQWPEVKWNISGQGIALPSYLKGQDKEQFVHDVVGNTFRILAYPAKGFQTHQPMPEDVRESFDALVKAGFTNKIVDAEWQTFSTIEALHSAPARAKTKAARQKTDLKR